MKKPDYESESIPGTESGKKNKESRRKVKERERETGKASERMRAAGQTFTSWLLFFKLFQTGQKLPG